LHNEELHKFYSSSGTIRIIKSMRMRWTGDVAPMVGEEKRPLGRSRSRWTDNSKIALKEIGWDVMDWIDMAQDRHQWRALVNTVMNLRVP
jgi:hypothetical protein